jgi:hypothetical protein
MEPAGGRDGGRCKSALHKPSSVTRSLGVAQAPLGLAARARPGPGFRRADDSIWRATLDFAFSPANPGFFAGENGGLGSRHNARSLAWPVRRCARRPPSALDRLRLPRRRPARRLGRTPHPGRRRARVRHTARSGARPAAAHSGWLRRRPAERRLSSPTRGSTRTSYTYRIRVSMSSAARPVD